MKLTDISVQKESKEGKKVLAGYIAEIKVLNVLFGVEHSEMSVITVINCFKTKIFSCEKNLFYLDRIF